jgi:hypothetical protein
MVRHEIDIVRLSQGINFICVESHPNCEWKDTLITKFYYYF